MGTSNGSRPDGGHALAKILKDEGVDYVFGLPGTLDVALRDALVGDREIKYVLAPHEFVAGTMADGYARASRKPSFANFHATSGPTFATGAIYNAYLDGSPVVFSTAMVESKLILQEQPYWPTDLTQFFKPFTKWSQLVRSPDDIPLAVRRAFKITRTKPTGPVFLAFPKDVLDGECRADLGTKQSYSFPSIVRPDPDQVSVVASLLLSSTSPVMFAGDGVYHEDAIDEAIELAELLAIPVVTEPGFSYKTNAFPSENKLYIGLYHSAFDKGGPAANIVSSCDVLLGVGCKMFVERGMYPRERRLPPHAKVVQVASNADHIAKNYPVDMGVYSDSKVFLQELIQCIRSRLTKKQKTVVERRRKLVLKLRDGVDRWREREAAKSYDSVPISGLRLAKDLYESMRKDGVLVNEGQTVGTYFTHVQFSRETEIFGQPGGALGWALPAAVGVQLALRKKQVVALVGDGCFTFSSQALWTAKNLDLPLVTVVCNNVSYVWLKGAMLDYKGAALNSGFYPGCDLHEPYIDYVKQAESYGIRGERIERPQDLKPAFRRWLNAGEPVVLDVVIDPRDLGVGRERLPESNRARVRATSALRPEP